MPMAILNIQCMCLPQSRTSPRQLPRSPEICGSPWQAARRPHAFPSPDSMYLHTYGSVPAHACPFASPVPRASLNAFITVAAEAQHLQARPQQCTTQLYACDHACVAEYACENQAVL